MSSQLFACDFETTVYEGQKSTEVWSAAYAQLFKDNCKVFHSIDEFFDDIIHLKRNCVLWFHNLRFDGSFILNFFFRKGWSWNNCKSNELRSYEFNTLISEQNRWYSIVLKTPWATISIRDSAKIMPMTLEKVGKAFNTKHRKLTMKYTGERYAGCHIKPEELEYIINDVLVLKEALEVMIGDGHEKLTIGGCALSEFKAPYHRRDYRRLFPKLDYEIPESFGSCTADEYIRRSYKGGFCYCKKKGRVGKGRTYDVNSLYPSVMHSKSGNKYPIGKPKFFKGEIPKEAKRDNMSYIVRFKTRFYLKEGMLPTVQIKGSPWYVGTRWLETSDIEFRGNFYREMMRGEEMVEAIPTLTMTKMDFEMFLEHYNIEDFVLLDGCYFYVRSGLFDQYIDKWMSIKEGSEGGARTEAKLFLNNLYGKFASSDDSSYRIPSLDKEGVLQLDPEEEHDKELEYILIGTYVTSHARCFTISHAQKNYDDFCYADTDSLHLEGEEHVGIDIHPSAMLKWKCEGEWSSAIFLRQKTYAEFIRKKDGKKVYPYWAITCAGMPEKCKKIFLSTHPITDFKWGLQVRGKLVPRQIKGGVILVETYFTLTDRK